MEHDIQYSIVTYLRLHHILCIENDAMSGLQFFSPKDGRRFAFIKHHEKMGYEKGQADLALLLKGGRCVFVELKTPKGRQSEEQKKFQRAVELLGFEYLIFRSLDDCINFVNKEKKNGTVG